MHDASIVYHEQIRIADLAIGDCIMRKRKRFSSDFELPMGAFRVRPDWYEEYWLKPEKESPPTAVTSWRHWNLPLLSMVSAAIVSVLAMFIRGGR